MTLEDAKSFIFDLDGTLFAIPVDWPKVRTAVEGLSGQPLDSSSLFENLKTIIEGDPGLRDPLFAAIDAAELEAADGARPMEGAQALVSSLSERTKLALVTMQGRKTVERILDRYHMQEDFDVVVTRNESLVRAEQIRLALRSLELPPGTAVMVGDRTSDIEASKEAHVVAVLIGRRREGVRPDFHFGTLQDLASEIAGTARRAVS